MYGGAFFKLGCPFLGRYMKMGQSRTRDGWGVQNGPKRQDVLYGRSLMSKSAYFFIWFKYIESQSEYKTGDEMTWHLLTFNKIEKNLL